MGTAILGTIRSRNDHGDLVNRATPRSTTSRSSQTLSRIVTTTVDVGVFVSSPNDNQDADRRPTRQSGFFSGRVSQYCSANPSSRIAQADVDRRAGMCPSEAGSNRRRISQ
jgi:hypothetical protein